MRTFDDKESGFTILELMVALCIVGILTSIALPAILNWNKITYDVQTREDVMSLSHEAGNKMNGAGMIRSINSVEEAGYKFASEDVILKVKADRSGICVTGYSPKGKEYNSPSTVLTAFNGREGVDCPDSLMP